jgi:hypothetical protein
MLIVTAKKWKMKFLSISGSLMRANEAPPTKIEIFCNQLLDSAIIGGISGLSAYLAAGEVASFRVFLLSFAMVFLVKMKGYRGIKEETPLTK